MSIEAASGSAGRPLLVGVLKLPFCFVERYSILFSVVLDSLLVGCNPHPSSRLHATDSVGRGVFFDGFRRHPDTVAEIDRRPSGESVIILLRTDF